MLLSHSKLENNGGERFHCKGEVNDFLFTLIRIPPPPLQPEVQKPMIVQQVLDV